MMTYNDYDNIHFKWRWSNPKYFQNIARLILESHPRIITSQGKTEVTNTIRKQQQTHSDHLLISFIYCNSLCLICLKFKCQWLGGFTPGSFSRLMTASKWPSQPLSHGWRPTAPACHMKWGCMMVKKSVVVYFNGKALNFLEASKCVNQAEKMGDKKNVPYSFSTSIFKKHSSSTQPSPQTTRPLPSNIAVLSPPGCCQIQIARHILSRAFPVTQTPSAFTVETQPRICA